MKQYIEKFIQYLRYERNVSPETIREYRRDMQQFAEFLAPPGEDGADGLRRSITGLCANMWDRCTTGGSSGRR